MVAAAVATNPHSVKANSLPNFYLPFDNGVSHYVTQGSGDGSHTGILQYACDFARDTNWLVRASIDGTVDATKDDSQTGGCDPSFTTYANYVKVLSSIGGTNYEELYLHLDYGSVSPRISLNQFVVRYTPLAQTDSTGWVCGGDHLHYQVQTPCSSMGCQSVPSSFLDADVLNQDSDGVPKKDQTVTSSNS
jgi:murein DD-endopeptidase MepM/ murein hydrolase activator NlpD